MDYASIITTIFLLSLAKQEICEGLRDCEFKDPSILFKIAQKNDLIFEKEKVLRVAGSKGKGTTSQFCARILQSMNSKHKIGLLLSPEELEPTDRIRINGQPISKQKFTDIFNKSKSIREYLTYPFQGNTFATPYGVFLLIALEYFQEQNVDYLVLESERGFRYDELYYIPSSVGVVSSIFEEKLDKIGPTLAGVVNNILGICDFSTHVIMPNNYLTNSKLIEHYTNLRVLPKRPLSASGSISWIDFNFNAARNAVRVLTGQLNVPAIVDYNSISYKQIDINNKSVHLQKIDTRQGLDTRWLKALGADKTTIMICIPDDEHSIQIKKALTSERINFKFYAQNGELSVASFNSECLKLINLRIGKEKQPPNIVILGSDKVFKSFHFENQALVKAS